jgi:hypothetical protein
VALLCYNGRVLLRRLFHAFNGNGCIRRTNPGVVQVYGDIPKLHCNFNQELIATEIVLSHVAGPTNSVVLIPKYNNPIIIQTLD